MADEATVIAVPVVETAASAKEAPKEAPVYKDLSELTPNQYDKYQLTGKLPTVKQSDTPEPKKAAKESAEEVEAAGESGTPAPKEKGKRGIGSLSPSELRALAREQEAELQRFRSATTDDSKGKVDTAAPAADAKAEKSRPKPLQTDKKEDGTPKYETLEDWIEDLAGWMAAEQLTTYQKNEIKKQQEAKVAEQNKVLVDSWNARKEKAAAKYSDFELALDPEEGPGKQIQPGSVMDQWILDSDLGAEILYFFAKNPKELTRIGSQHPIKAARELAQLEAKLSGEPASTVSPETKIKLTKAPPPTRELGGRGTAAVDEVLKAVADDDTGAYIAAANRRELAARKG